MKHDSLLFLGTSQDEAFLPRLKSCVGGAKVFVLLTPISTLYEITSYCSERNITGVITTSPVLLSKLLPLTTSHSTKLPSIDNYAGSFFTKSGLDFVVVSPLEQLISVPYGPFLTRRYVSKLTHPEKFINAPPFSWCILTPSNIQTEYDLASKSSLMAVDIETFKENLAIRCTGFTTLNLIDGQYVARSTVLPLDSEWALEWTKKFLALPSQKIMQNGKYDINYLMRYGIICHNYAWDTATLMHCLYSELPKDLGSLSAFFVRESMYWKDLAKTNDLEEYYLYNAKDTYQTALILLGWIAEAPKWALTNYQMEFPLLFPCIQSELTGIKRDLTRLTDANKKYTLSIEKANEKLSSELGVQYFNTNSPKQKASLLKILGCGDLDSTDEKSLAKARLRHPLNSRILSQVSSIQKQRKLLSTYLVEGKELNGRILYSLNPHGTDTGRLASKEHHFWCGLQVQNIPRGKEVKNTLVSDDGFLFAESDLEQAESRDTAFISGD